MVGDDPVRGALRAFRFRSGQRFRGGDEGF